MKKLRTCSIGHRLLALSALCSFAWANCLPPALADQYFDYGLRMFNQRNFVVAAQYFDMRLKGNPNDAYAQYYRALCHHYRGETEKARALYSAVTSNPSADTKVKNLAQAQLIKFDTPQVASSTTGGGTTSKGGTSTKGGTNTPVPANEDDDLDDDSIKPTVVPPNAKAYFTITPGHNDIIMEGALNKRRLQFCFDTGAGVTMCGKNHLQQLGIHPPTTKATSKITGIGGTIDSWTVKMDVTVGGITKRLPVRVAEEWDHEPLLGQDFFSDINYEIDNSGHCIHFTKSQDHLTAKDDMYSIPFSRVGRHLFVDLEGEKGKKTPMIVDTGAEGVSFSPRNIHDLGLDTTGGERELHKGVGGTSEGVGFVVDQLRLGPIIMRNIKVSADVGGKGMVGSSTGVGLLGQAFFSGWRFTVDNRNQRLRFFH